MSFNLVFPCEVDISSNTAITKILPESITTNLIVPKNIQDASGNTGGNSQTLGYSATGIRWREPAVRLAGGGTYTTPSPAIPNVAGQNFFVAQQNVVNATTTVKYMITISYTIQNATGVIYATMGRQQGATNPQVDSTSVNLASPSQTFISANSIGTPTYFATSNYATGAASTAMGTMVLVDTPNYVGTVSYGLWIRSSACNIVKYNIIALQIEP